MRDTSKRRPTLPASSRRSAREANRLHKAPEDTGIKRDCVASDILGKSGRAMLDALVTGTTDPAVLADLAIGKLRAKIPALREALQGRFEAHHALIIGAILAHLDFSTSRSGSSLRRSRLSWALPDWPASRWPARSPASPPAPPRSWSLRSAPT